MAAHQARRRAPRLAVVGQLRMVVEAVARTFDGVVRVRTVVLDRSCAAPAVRDAVLRERVDAVVLVMDAGDTIDALDVVRALAEGGQRVVVTGDPDGRATARDFRAAGATAYLPDGLPLVRRLVGLAVRQETAPPPTSEPAVPASAERLVRRNLASLSAAEARILWRLMHGASVTDIASEHVVSVATVRSQIRTILAKTESASRLGAVVGAWQIGWQPTPAMLEAA